MRISIPSSSVLSTDRVAPARQAGGHGAIVAVSTLIGGLGLLLLHLPLLLLILLLLRLLTPALVPSSEPTEQGARRRADRRSLTGISSNCTSDRAERRTPSPAA